MRAVENLDKTGATLETPPLKSLARLALRVCVISTELPPLWYTNFLTTHPETRLNFVSWQLHGERDREIDPTPFLFSDEA
jgi:hypothetical protein